MKGMTVQARDVLLAGVNHMQDRAATYDRPAGERSMAATVAAFNAITGKDLSEEQGWLLMVLLKAVRSQAGQFKLDNYEDGAAYFALMAEAGCAARAVCTAFDPAFDPAQPGSDKSVAVDLDKALADAAQALGFDKPAVDGLGEAVLFDAAGARVAWPADDRYQWFAVDASGRGWFYRCEKPVICRDSWSSSVGGFLPVEDRRFLSCNWQDSLRVRYPQEVAVHG